MIKAEAMNANRERGCSLLVSLDFPEEIGLRGAQAMTFRMAAELAEAMDPDIELANYGGTLSVDGSVVRVNNGLRTFIRMEAMDDEDLVRAEAVARVVHDITELLDPRAPFEQ